MTRTILAVAAVLAMGCSGSDADPCGVVGAGPDRYAFVCQGETVAPCWPGTMDDALRSDIPVFMSGAFVCDARGVEMPMPTD